MRVCVRSGCVTSRLRVHRPPKLWPRPTRDTPRPFQLEAVSRLPGPVCTFCSEPAKAVAAAGSAGGCPVILIGVCTLDCFEIFPLHAIIMNQALSNLAAKPHAQLIMYH